MPLYFRKCCIILLLAVLLVVVIPVIFGEAYLIGVGLFGLFVLIFIRSGLRSRLWPGSKQTKTEKYDITPSATTRRIINQAKLAIRDADPALSLRHLSGLKSTSLEVKIVALDGRYAEHTRKSRFGLLSTKEETMISDQIKQDIIDLLIELENELIRSTDNYQIIRDYLKNRYSNRLEQKLAKRQPVNLHCRPSTDGTSEERSTSFITYSSDEIPGTIVEIFQKARGRLLLIGTPGAGKTTLMLQLVLELLESEPDSLPVLLSLATWTKEYSTLEAWLQKILPAELGISDKYAKEIIKQNPLVILLDGLDETQAEDRFSCLEAIGRYGQDSYRKYVISSRIEEYKTAAKDAPVHWQIEVGPLTIEQIEIELQHLWENEERPVPEARALIKAAQKDVLLQKSLQTPFYFNTLQILFSGGNTLADLNFSANTSQGRQTEILNYFVEYELKVCSQKEYPLSHVKHWLSFLASRMTSLSMAVFELKDLQYGWWSWSKWQLTMAIFVGYLIAGLAVGMVFGLTIGLIFGLELGLAVGMNFGLAFGLILGLIFGSLFGSSFGLLFGPVFGIVFGLLGALLGRRNSPITGLIGGAIGILVKKPIHIFTKDNPKWSKKMFGLSLILGLCFGAANTLILDVFAGLIAALVAIMVAILSFFFLSDYADIIQITNPYQRFKASAKNLHFSILQHWLLRYQLYNQGLLPFRLVDFLNEMSARHILETDGATWRFRHRILQEWFAERWVEPETKTRP